MISDNHYSERYLWLYLLCRARSKKLRCRAGRHILKSKYFDNIYCEVESQEKCLLCLFNTKQHRYKNKRITFSELVDSSFDYDFDLRKYFEAYLQFKKRNNKPIQELAVLCRTDFDRNDFTSRDVKLDFIDLKNVYNLIEPLEFDIHRQRIEPNSTIEKELVKSNYFLYNLAETIAHLMFKKFIISRKNVSKRFFLLFLKDVFKDETFFKDEFIRSTGNMSCEVKQFYDLLEFVLAKRFQKRNLLDFYQLLQIEQIPFAELVQTKVIDGKLNRRNDSDATWHLDYSVSQVDVQQFLSLLVFYEHAPTRDQYEGVLQRYCDKETQNLMEKICGRELMIEGNSNRLKSFTGLLFKADLLMDLEKAVLMSDTENVCNKLIIEYGDNSIEHFLDETDLLKDKYKFFNLMNFIVTYNIKRRANFIIDKHHNAPEYVEDFNFREITIVPEINEPQSQETTFYTDKLNYGNLPEVTKMEILSTVVLLQGRHIQLSALLSESDLETIPMATLCEWSQDCFQEIVIGEPIEPLELEHLIPRKIQNNNSSSLDPFETNYEPLAILCGLPGTGKSTLLMQLAVNFSELYDDHIVLLLDFKEIVDMIDCAFDLNVLIFRLLDINSEDNIKKIILNRLVDDHRIILLLDGFDEISSKKEKNAISMMIGLKHANLQLVMIATRPHRLEILQKHLDKSTIYHILPFTELDQFQFLQKRLSDVSSNASLIPDLIRTFKSLFKDENLLDIPIQCEIIASIYEHDLADQFSQQWKPAEVLQKFIDTKFKVFADKFFNRFSRAHEVVLQSLKSSFEADHSELAFRLDTNQIVDNESFTKLEPYGLLQIDNGATAFINDILVKFFAAQYILRHQADQSHFNQYMLENFCKPDTSRFDSFLEYHISKTDSRQKLFNSITPSQSMNLKELRQLQQYQLHSDKIKQWHIFLIENCTLEQQLEYLRRTVSKSQFSTFQVIYESLPESLVKEIRFTFASNADNPFVVNLEKASEDHLVQLLKIFHHEHPKEIAKKIIANFNCDEDDFITTAIKRDLRSVIEQLFYVENNLYDEKESEILQEFLGGRWPQYLRLVAEYRRDALLEDLLGFVVNRFHPRVIKHFLMNCNISRVLIQTFKDEYVDAQIVTRVLNFVERHLSDHNLYVLLNRIEDEWAEKLEDLRNPTVSEMFKSFWKRYWHNALDRS